MLESSLQLITIKLQKRYDIEVIELTLGLRERFVRDLKEGGVPLMRIAHNANVHGGFVVSVIDPIQGAHYNGLVDQVVLKSSPDYEAVSGEHGAIRQMHATLPSHPDFARVVGLFAEDIPSSPDGNHHLLLDRVHGPSAEQVIQAAPLEARVELLKRMAGFTAQAHAYMGDAGKNTALEEFDKYAQRLEELNGEKTYIPQFSALLGALRESSRFIYEMLAAQPSYFRKDPNPQNWLVDERAPTSDVVAIDWEVGRGSVPREYELSKLLSQGSHIPRTEVGDRIRQLVIDQYLATFSDAHGNSSDDKMSFAYRTALADIPKAFAFMSFAIDKPGRYSTATEYLVNAVHSIGRIVEKGEFAEVHSPTFNRDLDITRRIYTKFAAFLSGTRYAQPAGTHHQS